MRERPGCVPRLHWKSLERNLQTWLGNISTIGGWLAGSTRHTHEKWYYPLFFPPFVNLTGLWNTQFPNFPNHVWFVRNFDLSIRLWWWIPLFYWMIIWKMDGGRGSETIIFENIFIIMFDGWGRVRCLQIMAMVSKSMESMAAKWLGMHKKGAWWWEWMFALLR